MAIATYSLVALDCPDPPALAVFYQDIVGGRITQQNTTGDWVRLRMDHGADIAFQRVTDYEPPNWPDGNAQQAHLDFDVDDLDAGEAAVLAVGARKTGTQPMPHEWRVFLDPVGHPFCLVKV